MARYDSSPWPDTDEATHLGANQGKETDMFERGGRGGPAAGSRGSQDAEASVVRMPRERTPTIDPADVSRYQSIGVGAGPANLSLAALFESVAPEEIALFDRRPAAALPAHAYHIELSWDPRPVAATGRCARCGGAT